MQSASIIILTILNYRKHLKQGIWVHPFFYKLHNTIHSIFAVGCVCHAEPLACRVENFTGSSAIVDEFVDH